MNNYSKKELSKEIDRRNESIWRKSIIEEAESKSKVKHWIEMKGEIPTQRPEYMNKLTRKQCHSIIKARSRMIPCKINQRNRYSDTTCRFCEQEEENQTHLFNNCTKVPVSERESYQRLFIDDNENLREIATRIVKIIDLLEETEGNK